MGSIYDYNAVVPQNIKNATAEIRPAIKSAKDVENVTNLKTVPTSDYYGGPGSVIGQDIEGAWWDMYNGKDGGGGAGGGGVDKLTVQGRSPDFMKFQDQTTQYMSDLMSGAKAGANNMFGQKVYNQMTGDNDVTVQREMQRMTEMFGQKGIGPGHPAYEQGKRDLIQNSRMFNARAFTDLAQKAGQYQIAIGDLAKNYYDVFSTKEEDQQKLQLAADQFNIDMQMKQNQMAASAGAMASGQKLAALEALTANRKWEIQQAEDVATTELNFRQAEHVTQLNLALEREKLKYAQQSAASQESNNILAGIIGFAGSVLGGPVGGLVGGLFGSKTASPGSSTPTQPFPVVGG